MDKLVRVTVEFSDGVKGADGSLEFVKAETVVKSVPVSPSDQVEILAQVEDSLNRHSVRPA